MKARTYQPPRGTPYQSYLATQRRAKWAWRIAKFAVGLVVVLIACGRIGS